MTDGTTAAATAATTAATATTTTAAAPWHAGVEETTLGFWQNKGLDPSDPKKVAEGLTKFYREVERFVGAPPEEMIRVPKPNAAPADIAAYWQRIGVPLEAKDYDLSPVKRADGSAPDSALVDAFRTAAHSSRVPKEQAAPLLAAVIKQLDTADAAALANKTSIVNDQRKALDANWGTNKTYNLAVAERTLGELARAAGLTAEQGKAAWDALSLVGGVGAAHAMEMLRTIGAKMGEAPFIGAQPGQGGNNAVMSVAQAKAEIDQLKGDKGFYKKLMDKDQTAHRHWNDLHKIAYPSAA